MNSQKLSLNATMLTNVLKNNIKWLADEQLKQLITTIQEMSKQNQEKRKMAEKTTTVTAPQYVPFKTKHTLESRLKNVLDLRPTNRKHNCLCFWGGLLKDHIYCVVSDPVNWSRSSSSDKRKSGPAHF